MASRRLVIALAPLVLASALAVGLQAAGAHAEASRARAVTYTVRPGDSLWSISRRTAVPVDTLASLNHLDRPDRLMPGQRLLLSTGAGEVSEPVRGAAARALLTAAAREFGVSPAFVEAVSIWESGENQTMISSDGAVGLMQLMPLTADWAGPALLGQRVDIYRARDNARLGTALLRHYLDEFNDPKLALAAFYQGERATKKYGVYPSSRQYVNGIWALRNQLAAAA